MLSKISEFVMGVVARFRSEAGQALAEYGLILALIAVVCILALTGPDREGIAPELGSGPREGGGTPW
jgi:Flp pilus assembly pilin Flp